MLSAKDDSSVEDYASSIGDSAWDLVDDGSIGASDDEYHRLSRQQTAASDGQGEEADIVDRDETLSAFAASLGDETSADTFRLQGDDAPLANIGATSESDPLQTSAQDQKDCKIAQGYSKVLSDTDNSQASEAIRLEATAADDSAGDDDETATSTFKILESFEGLKLDQLSSVLPIDRGDCKVIGTVRQTMASGLCQPDGSYKVLYFGAETLRGPIIQRIGSALVSRMRPNSKSNGSLSSTFSIIPVSAFGSQSSPEVVLVNSSALQICVDHCMSARLGEQHGEDVLYVSLDNGEALCSVGRGPFTITSNYTLPDLGIICIGERETSSAKSGRALVHAFMKRHCIPYILISPCKSWTEASPCAIVDMRLPHLCVEIYSSSLRGSRILARSPIDLASFMSLDPIQMSRSLAHVHRDKNTEICDTERAFVDVRNGQDHLNQLRWLAESWRFHTSPDVRLLSGPRLLASVGVFLCSILACLLFLWSNTPSQKFSLTGSSPPNPTWGSLSAKATALPVGTLSHLLPESTTITACSDTMAALSTHSSGLSPTVIESNLIPVNKPEDFVVYATGKHIILHPPRWLEVLKQSPTLAFTASRGNENIDFIHAVSVSGIHTFKFRQDDAHGPLNITVWTIRKPLLKETFLIDFGSSWSESLTWRAADKLITRQAQLSFEFTRSHLQYSLALTTMQVQLSAQYIKEAMGLSTQELRVWSSTLASNANQVILTAWEKNHHKLPKSLLGPRIRTFISLKLPRERITWYVSKLVDSILSPIPKWMQKNHNNGRYPNTLDIVGKVQQYRETHLVDSQILAVRLWWGIRGGPPPRTGELRSRVRERKDDTGYQLQTQDS